MVPFRTITFHTMNPRRLGADRRLGPHHMARAAAQADVGAKYTAGAGARSPRFCKGARSIGKRVDCARRTDRDGHPIEMSVSMAPNAVEAPTAPLAATPPRSQDSVSPQSPLSGSIPPSRYPLSRCRAKLLRSHRYRAAFLHSLCCRATSLHRKRCRATFLHFEGRKWRDVARQRMRCPKDARQRRVLPACLVCAESLREAWRATSSRWARIPS